MNFRDSCEMSVVIQNLTEKLLNVKIGMRASNADFGKEHVKQLGFAADIPGI
jgi:hypothetical protein